jgi:hypothetical protein
MAGRFGEAELVALLVAGEQTIMRAIEEAGIDPEVAAAACAALAGEYTALAAAASGVALAPLLREAVQTLRQRAKETALQRLRHGTGGQQRQH